MKLHFLAGLTEQALEIPSILFQNESQIWSIVQDIAPDARFVSIRHGTPHTTQIRLFLRICSRFSRNSPFLFHIIFWSKHSKYVISLRLRILVNTYNYISYASK